jgi:transcriptional regulator with XRE-family HTH domain
MIKKRLIEKRIEKNKKQEEMAYLLGITQSQYSRRESGVTKITKNEWNTLVEILDTNLETIYESEDNIYILNKKKDPKNYNSEDSEFTFTVLKKYIEKLEQENKYLKSQLECQ